MGCEVWAVRSVLTDDQKDVIRALYRANYPARLIAAQVGCSLRTVYVYGKGLTWAEYTPSRRNRPRRKSMTNDE